MGTFLITQLFPLVILGWAAGLLLLARRRYRASTAARTGV